jgi:hypothetical protein
VKPPTTRRWRVKLAVCALAAWCAAVALLAGAVPAGAAQPQGPQGKTVEIAFKIGPLPAVGATQHAAASADCAPSFGTFDRHDACWGVALTFIFLINGKPVGTTVAGLEQSIHLNPGVKAGPVTWTEDDTVLGTASRGRTAPIVVTLEASCDKPCHTVAHLKGVLRRGLHGTVQYTDHLAVSEINRTPTHYKLLWVAPPFLPLNFPKWNSPWIYRCDRALAGIRGPGCVFPKFTPTLILSRREFGAAAAMIQWAQKNLDARWGLPGGEPLTRLAGSAAATKNRDRICDPSFVRMGTKIGGPRDKDSCDEFPFAATNQSGAAGPNGLKSGKTCAQVKAFKSRKSGTEAEQWNGVKPIGTFSRDAKCVRGHIPSKLNIDLGRNKLTGYRGFIASERLLNDDRFYLKVTS